MFDFDTVVVGAGVVGLACAAARARAGDAVLVLEAEKIIGSGTSSRNSEVIHAGLYYPTGGLKHRMCVRGRRLLYPYLEARGVKHKKCGKLVVATDSKEESQIAAIFDRAQVNEVENVSLLTGGQALALEPALSCVSALLSAETGVLDSHGFMLALRGELEDHGGAIAFKTPAERIEVLPAGGFMVRVGGAEPISFICRSLINCAGLHARALASRIEGYDLDFAPHMTFAKGSYFGCAAKSPFERLIYPAPVNGGLGVHVTLDLAGRMRFGPDVEWLDAKSPEEVNYDVDLKRSESFYAAVRRYWPGLPDGAITPDYAGCRPKISACGEPAADFRIDDEAQHGVEGLVHLFGIESPGLTSALAIAEVVSQALDRS